MKQMNTTITIKNEHGEFSVSAPIEANPVHLLNLFKLAAQVAGWNSNTIEHAIVEMSENKEFDIKQD